MTEYEKYQIVVKLSQDKTLDWKTIKETRQERHLTQESLGKLVGVQKSQISRLESNASNVIMDTLIKVFGALKATVKFQVELSNSKFSISG